MNISSFHDCADCGACYNICPVNAISVRDGLFFTPEVDPSKCIDCSKCVDVCPVNNDLPKLEPLSAYSAVHRNKQIVANSSSGGAFTALAEAVINSGGVVYAAAYSEDCRQVLFSSSDVESLDALRRSKYVESEVSGIFKEIKAQLFEGREVLFCGTPCQTAGLYRFLGERPQNLLTCDFTCGGLPSHQLYRDYLEGLEKKYRSRAVKVNFRPKAYGWREYAVSVDFENGKRYLRQACLDPYFSAFLHKQYSIRDYCAKCRFADNHQADIVLADFWRTRQISGESDDDTGISLIVTMTEKGKAAVEGLSKSMQLSELELEKAVYNFRQKELAPDYINNRNRYLDACRKDGLFDAGKTYCTVSGGAAVKAYLRGFSRRK